MSVDATNTVHIPLVTTLEPRNTLPQYNIMHPYRGGVYTPYRIQDYSVAIIIIIVVVVIVIVIDIPVVMVVHGVKFGITLSNLDGGLRNIVKYRRYPYLC